MRREEILKLLELPLLELCFLADRAREEVGRRRIELCAITNAKSGLCPEDCKFCAQSARHKAQAPIYPLKSREILVEEARRAKEMGAERFSIVTSGRALGWKEVREVAEAVREIREKVGIKVCASLGMIEKEKLLFLKEAGLSRYHHNIETSPEYFPKVVTTHTLEEKIRVIRDAKEIGLEVCSGGIIGMGESWEDRVNMAFLLRELEVDSVPLNFLIPIKGTPLEHMELISAEDAVRTVAIFRLILPDKAIRLCGGREKVLGDFQGLAFLAGADAMMIGGYLTVRGREAEEDRKLAREAERIWNG